MPLVLFRNISRYRCSLSVSAAAIRRDSIAGPVRDAKNPAKLEVLRLEWRGLPVVQRNKPNDFAACVTKGKDKGVCRRTPAICSPPGLRQSS